VIKPPTAEGHGSLSRALQVVFYYCCLQQQWCLDSVTKTVLNLLQN